MEDDETQKQLTQHKNSRILKEKTHNMQPENRERKTKIVSYIYSPELIGKCDQLPKVPNRASMVHDLISAYDLLSSMTIVKPNPAKEEKVKLFHSEDYIECLKTLSEEDHEKYEFDAEMYGLTYDCPSYPGMYEYATLVAGASITAAQSLMMGLADIAINWTGGWHHAKRDEAAGFCYINDIVLAILHLRQKFKRVLYVDIDLHHGDGVEDAFCATTKVMTVSFHKTSPGFFPGTGGIKEVGIGKGKYYSLNVPLLDGIQDERYVQVFESVMETVNERFAPDAVVCQCGADSLAQDPMATYNLTPVAISRCVQYLMAWNKPLLLLGGGGYHLANTARCWAYITGLVVGRNLAPEIPEHRWFPEYGPDYELSIEAGNRADRNDDKYINQLIATVNESLSKVGS